MKPHKTIKRVLIAKDRKQRKYPITFPFCISLLIYATSIITCNLFLKLNKQMDFLKSKISRSCLATFKSLFIKLEASSPSLVFKICSSLKQTILATFIQDPGRNVSLSI